MEVGAIYSGRWIKWLRAGRQAPVGLGHLSDETLVGVNWAGLRALTAPARRCTACHIVEFDYEADRERNLP